jgi:hypothetical protein
MRIYCRITYDKKVDDVNSTIIYIYLLTLISCGLIWRSMNMNCFTRLGAKSSIEVTKCTSSNILVWFGRDAPKKSVAGLRESLISSFFAKFAKGLE